MWRRNKGIIQCTLTGKLIKKAATYLEQYLDHSFSDRMTPAGAAAFVACNGSDKPKCLIHPAKDGVKRRRQARCPSRMYVFTFPKWHVSIDSFALKLGIESLNRINLDAVYRLSLRNIQFRMDGFILQSLTDERQHI